MSSLTTAQIAEITDHLVELRKELIAHGDTALNPTTQSTALRKQFAQLNRKLNADAAAKRDASEVETAIPTLKAND